MHHTFEYGDVLDHQNLDKLTKNYEAFEKTIKELENELAIHKSLNRGLIAKSRRKKQPQKGIK